MEEYFVPIYLALGIVLAAILTRWVNWFAWGENRRRKIRKQEQRRTRLKAHDSEDENDNP